MKHILAFALALSFSRTLCFCQRSNILLYKLSAPTYYLAIEAQRAEPAEIHFRGASNLPATSEVYVQVSAFYHDGWKEYSDNVCIPIDGHGFFEGDIRPKNGMKFENNVLLRAVFETQLCHQPLSTLQEVGKHGERLTNLDDQNVSFRELGAGRSPNPQLFQVSGWYYGLEVIARAPNVGPWPSK